MITSVVAEFVSAYAPGRNFDMVAGNAIYSALLATRHVDTGNKNLLKVSHGIFQEIPYVIKSGGKVKTMARDHRGHPVSTAEGKSQVSKIKTYRDFFLTRQYITPYRSLAGEYDDLRIIHSQDVRLNNSVVVNILHPHYLLFFVVTKDGSEIDLHRDDELRIGGHRNLGFGCVRVLDVGHIKLNEIDYSVFDDNEKLISDAMNGISGIYNHKKYGYGEYQIDKWRDGWIVKLTTPMCMRSTIRGANIWGRIPSFLREDDYRERIDRIWIKRRIHELACIDRGQVFGYEG